MLLLLSSAFTAEACTHLNVSWLQASNKYAHAVRSFDVIGKQDILTLPW